MYTLLYSFILQLALIEVNNKKYRKVFTIIIAFFLVLMAGFRSPNVDADYHVYASRFEILSTLSLRELINLTFSLSIEPGFLLLNVVVSKVGLGSAAFFFLVATLAISLKSIFIYRYTPYIGIAFALYFSHIYLHTELIQIRGGLAVSILLFSIKYLSERRFLKFLAIVLLATSIHKMAILSAPVYFLYSQKFFSNKRYIFTGIILCLLSLFISPIEILNTLLAGSIPIFELYYGWDRYNYSLGYFNPTFIKGTIVFTLLYFSRDKLYREYGDFYRGATFLLFVAMVWLFVFRDFAILAARGAAFINTADYIITPAIIYAFSSKTIIFISVLFLTVMYFYLNIYVKAVVGPYEILYL